MGGLVRLPVAGRDVLIFSNIVSPGPRQNGHVWASFDGGKTWPVKRQVYEGPVRLFVARRRPPGHAQRRLDLSVVRGRSAGRRNDRTVQPELAAGRRKDRRRGTADLGREQAVKGTQR